MGSNKKRGIIAGGDFFQVGQYTSAKSWESGTNIAGTGDVNPRKNKVVGGVALL